MGKSSRRANRASRSAAAAPAAPVDEYPVITQVVAPDGTETLMGIKRVPRSWGADATADAKAMVQDSFVIAVKNILEHMTVHGVNTDALEAVIAVGISSGLIKTPKAGQGVLLKLTTDEFTGRDVPLALMEEYISRLETLTAAR